MMIARQIISILLVAICVTEVWAQNEKLVDYEIEGMTLAITNMEQMVDFYTNTFNIKFEESELNGFKLYSGMWGELKLLFCPAELAGNKATQNRHQFDVIVSDLNTIETITLKYGGKLMGGRSENDEAWNLGIYDPDLNSILFKQVKK